MPSQKWMSRFRPSKGGKSVFEDWPPAPEVIQVPLGEPGKQEARGARLDSPPRISYKPAILIGLGRTGGIALSQWVDLLEDTRAGRQEMLRGALIADSAITLPQTDCLTLHHFDPSISTLNANRDVVMQPVSCRREEVHRLFCQPRQFADFQSFLQTCLADLRKDVRVIIVGSLRESAIGVLGEVLQALRLTKIVEKSPFLSVAALLSLASPAPMLDDDEMYAALREIGRFTCSGWHKMKVQPSMTSGGDVIRSALLDHLFIVDWQYPPPLDIDFRKTPFEQGIGQALSEAVFALLHPSADKLWEHLVNNLIKSGNARKATRQAFVNSLSVASLHTPFTEINDYIAARLAYAVWYGERRDRPQEGLISPVPTPQNVHSRGELLAKRWLRNGPCAHPLFEWLLAVNDPSQFQILPKLSSAGFEGAFQAQIAHGIQALLNDPSENGQFLQIRATLQWLSASLKRWGEWLQQVSSPTEDVAAYAILKNLLDSWRTTVNDLDDQVLKWENVFYGTQAEKPLFPSLDQENLSESIVIKEYLTKKLSRAQEGLKTVAAGQIRRSLTADTRGHLVEVETYYSDTIRPELSHYGGLENSRAFLRARHRLGWWISLKPGYPSRLYMVCIPSNIAGGGERSEPPENARFTPDQSIQLAKALLQITAEQERRLVAELAGEWMRQRLKEENLIAFLRRRVSEPLLLYDDNVIATLPYANYAEERYYLIAQDKSTTDKYKKAVFFDASALINELENGEPGRLTALSLWLNIPIDSIESVREAYQSYFHQERVHLYPQERLATYYERRVRSYNNGKWEEFPPEFSMPLVDVQLVSLFCQAVICGLIDVFPDTPDRWEVLLDDDVYQRWKLADAGNWGLWDALKSFVLEKPHDPELNQDPTSPFHREKRRLFLENLTTRVRKCRQSSQFKEKCQQFREKHLNIWQQRGEQDALARALARLLQAELDEPSWRS